jgi:hexosaminidase
MLRKKERAGIIVGESAAFLICLIFLVQVFATKAGQLNLVPLPAKVTQFPGQFSLDAKTIVTADSVFTNEAALLANELHLPYVMDVPTSTSENQIRLTMQKSENLGDEAYRLEVNQQGVTIHAHTAAGAFYGCQTLKQLVKTDTRQIPSVRIEDAPRYVWRGMMLDVSRHFFDEQTVRQMLDWMADYKLNRLHLHLTDDQAWRLEISRYPELTQIGARGNYTDSNAPAHYFTRSQMLEIIAYAAQRHIVVVPEIDLPGHAGAATRTFPQLDGGAHTFNPAQPETYDFLQNVLRETMDIFPSQWIHLGGDEVDLTGWNQRADIAK